MNYRLLQPPVRGREAIGGVEAMSARKKILIVDDGIAARHWTRTIFATDYLTEQAAHGEEALAKLPLFKPDLILLDIEMPRLGGLETCRIIRKDPNFRFVKIIFVSANVSLADRLAGYEAGGDDYVTKPYDEGELFAKVKTLLRLKNEEELNHLKSNFLSLISHETRTPINGLLGCAELLQGCTEGKARQLAEGILQSGRHLHRLIENVLLICKLKSMPVTVRQGGREQVGVLMQNQLTDLEEAILRKNLSIALTGSLFATVGGCKTLLGKGFHSVLDNAVKFSAPQGQVRIDIAESGDRCVVCIADQGPGIGPEVMEHLFDEFAVSDVDHHHRGLGIGLAIASQIFVNHGGQIRAENGPEGGACFTVTLPLASALVSA
ncbi:MAG: hybrid sensor histidine kinase/response regulator [Desulfobulbaceae bacterium]|nr:hybrid sensor histidine kinase/response regulator [Desulfobulbaceae bacterium]